MSTPPSRSSFSSATRGRLTDQSPSRSGITTSMGQGLVRNPSLRSSRPIRKIPTRTSTANEMEVEEDLKAVNAQLIADLKEQVERAEQASEQYRRQLDSMQRRLDEVANETTAAEERELHFRTQIDKLQAEVRDNTRQTRELELSYDSEKRSLLRDKETHSTKAVELQSVVNRLTETLRLKNQELNHTIHSSTGGENAKPDHQQQSTVDNEEYQYILHQKDSIIENLQLELADFHLKVAEQEHLGNTGSQAIEKELLDIKMRNARLQEENESFQMLLSEKTLKGDFIHENSATHAPVSSLADELESLSEVERTPETYRTLEAENKGLRESNKALTLYVDKIIGRLLQHEGFEHIITDKDDPSQVPGRTIDKALPEPPTEKPQPQLPMEASKQTNTPKPVAAAASAAAGFLQRARSVVARPGGQTSSSARPMSYMAPVSSANENPQTAPSIPINRGHRRARSDQATDLGAAAVVAQMNRGSPLRTASGGPMSPGISPLSPISNQRASYFGPSLSATTTASRVPSESTTNKRDSSSNSIVSERSLEIEGSTDASSARASIHGSVGPGLPGAVMKQNQLRPLRLVQEQAQADEEAQKKANRGSWMGWFKQGNLDLANH